MFEISFITERSSGLSGSSELCETKEKTIKIIYDTITSFNQYNYKTFKIIIDYIEIENH